MNAISVSANAIGGTATAMNGRRRPIGVWNVSLHGPMTSGSVMREDPLRRQHRGDQHRRVL